MTDTAAGPIYVKHVLSSFISEALGPKGQHLHLKMAN
jgi:hypothetical protein